MSFSNCRDSQGGSPFEAFFGELSPVFSFETPSLDLWERLKAESRPLFLYGTGNGADKIIDALDAFGIRLSGVFASPGFERDRQYRGFKVESYEGVRERFGDDITVLLAFGTTRSEVREFIELLDSRHTLLIPDVPLYGGELFTGEYFERNADKIKRARALFCDEISLRTFDALIAFRLTGKYSYLLETQEVDTTVKTLFDACQIKCAVDLGAYKGDSAAAFAESFADIEKIYAFEPDPKTFEKLSAFAENFEGCQIIPENYAARDREDTLTFSGSASRGAGVMGQNKRAKEKTVFARTVDSFCFDGVDFIKYDVEGDEERALIGSQKTIERCKPSLSVSLYHRTEDFFKLPLFIADMISSYKEQCEFYLRRPPCIPFWDVNLWVVKK